MSGGKRSRRREPSESSENTVDERAAAAAFGLTRRAFVRGGVSAGASGVLAGTASARANRAGVSSARRREEGSFAEPGKPSRAAHRALAALERTADQRAGPLEFERTVDAATYLDLGPDDPVDEALERADDAGDLDGVRLDFSTGTYRFAGDCTISPAGAFGVVGPRATFRVDPGVRCEMNIHDVSRGLFSGLTFDQRADRAAVSVLFGTDGHIDARNLTFRGPVEALDDGQRALVRPVAANRKASVRVDGLRALGGTNAGSHAWVRSEPPPTGQIGGGVPGAFVGAANEGVVQFVEPELRGWENGLYASRTPGAVQVVGGRFVNNNNTGVRISGETSFCDGATVLLDATRWPANQPGEFTVGEIQGVSAARSETGPLDKAGARLRNLDVRGVAMGRCPGLIVYNGSASAGTMKNCRLTNDIDGVPAVRIDAPGDGPHAASSGSQAIRMEHVEIRGTATGAPAVRGTDARPNSVLANSCVLTPGASPDAVVDVETENVGYGSCESGQGLERVVGAPAGVPAIREMTVQPPSRGPGLRGFAVFVGSGAAVAFSMATVLPALIERVRDV